jgi:hypothetical protein
MAPPEANRMFEKVFYPFLSGIHDWIRGLFRPPPNATKGQIRKSGLLLALVGLVLLAAGLASIGAAYALFKHLKASVLVGFPVITAGFGGVIVGGFRAVMGVESDASSSENGMLRLLLGVALGFGALVLLAAMAVATAAILGS